MFVNGLLMQTRDHCCNTLRFTVPLTIEEPLADAGLEAHDGPAASG